ncbi:hypothetical protein D8674_035128 [Pyrus ussuriensis x Pyrus communis]|uniref:Uncharacterized protein n=1 Tax=Pyrus ussuriensis x Pyrus communis TaxID=2448454 RepID=A0A5N5GH18_9ROSA|nr:hypothetical protein D8674_035128 [Pyrus ussuriensis x Pyrus communis]
MTNVIPHNTVVGSNEVVDQDLSSRSKLLLDYGHTWHPDSFGTQFLNGTLTIARNGLSLDNDWCDPNKVPHWAFKNVTELLQDRVRANPTKFSVMDCFPPSTNILEVDEASLSQASILVDQSNGHRPNDLVSLPHKRVRLAINPKSRCPLHLSNKKNKGTRHKGRGDCGGYTTHLNLSDMAYEDQLITEDPTTPSIRVSKIERFETHEQNKGGDFNELLHIHENEGGPVRPKNQILAFRSTVNDCDLFYLGFDGNQHTWVTTRSDGIKERLDQV